MQCKCIWPGCDKVWGEPESGVTGYSHGLCLTHARLSFAPAFRKQQIREGNPDCYLRCFGYCHRHWCTFHPICPIENPTPENLAELKLRLEARSKADNFTNGS